MNAKVRVIDNNGIQLNDLDLEEFDLYENGERAELVDLTCIPPEEDTPISGIIAIDLSASMFGEGLDLAKQGASAWINFTSEETENAIVGFTGIAFLVSDFNKDKSDLEAKINNLEALGGTNFDEAFLGSSGSLYAASRAKEKPVIILLTDGFSQASSFEIITKANELNASVYTIVLYQRSPPVLREISSKTGGFVFDSVTSNTEIINAYKSILELSTKEAYCDISWLSYLCDLNRDVDIFYSDSLAGDGRYSVSLTKLLKIDYPMGKFLVFEDVPPNNDGYEIITLAANLREISIESIKSDNPLFSIDTPTEDEFPFTIPVGEERNIRVRFSNNSTDFEVARFDIESDACLDKTFYAAGGDQSSVPGLNSIKVEFPNGGEEFQSGSSNTISWSGVLPDDEVQVDFSYDKGLNWRNLTGDAINFFYRIDYPNIESDECLVRVTQFSKDFGNLYLRPETDSVNHNSLSWHPNGQEILAGGVDGKIRFYNAFKGVEFFEQLAHNGEINSVKFAPDGLRFVSGGDDGKLIIWNSLSKQILHSKDLFSGILSIDWSPNGEKIVVGLENGNIIFINSIDYQIVYENNVHNKSINSVKFSPNSEFVASGSNDSLINIYNSNDYDIINSWKAELSNITDISWVGNTELLSSSDRDNNNRVRHWDFDGNQIEELDVIGQTNAIAFNSKYNLFAFAGLSGMINLYNLATYQEEIEYEQGSVWAMQDIEWSPDSTRFVVAINNQANGRTLNFYSIDIFPSSSDVSDDVFSLKNFQIVLPNIQMGEEIIGRIKELEFNDILTGQFRDDFTINNFEIRDDPDNIFSLDFTSNSSTLSSEFIFAPLEEKEYRATLFLETNYGNYESEIIGTGVSPFLPDGELDFGEVLIETEKELNISLQNISDEEIDILNIDLIDFNNVFKIVNTNFPASINPDSPLDILVNYSPISENYHNAIIKIEHSGKDSLSYVKLTGRGILPILEIDALSQFSINCNELLSGEIVLRNSGTGTLIINSIENNFEIEELNNQGLSIRENTDTTFIFSNYELINNQLVIDINSSIVDTTLTIPVNIELPTFDIIEDNIDFIQNSENNFETKFFTVVNTGEVNVHFTSDFPVELEAGLLTINNLGPSILLPMESTSFSVDFSGGNFGDNGDLTYNLIDSCGVSDSLQITWLIQDESDPIIIQVPDTLKLLCDDYIEFDLNIINLSGEIIPLELELLSSQFNIENNLNEIKANSNNTLKLSFNSDISGIFNDIIIIKYFDFEKQIELVALKEELSYDIFENSLNVNNTNTFTLIIDNNGSVELDLLNSQTNGFEIISSSNNPLEPNGQATITVLSQNYINRYFGINTVCGIIDSTFIRFGNTNNLEISIPILNYNIGDIIAIPVDIETSSTKFIDFRISYNSTLLDYNGSRSTTKINGYETVYFEDFDVTQPVLDGEFQVLWGNDSTSTIDVEIPNEEEYATLIVGDGLLRILDLCQEGGTRLFFSNKLNIEMGPNPNNGILNINYESELNNTVQIEIINSITGVSHYKGDHLLQIGEGNFDINLKDLPQGVFIIKSKINNKVSINKLIIN